MNTDVVSLKASNPMVELERPNISLVAWRCIVQQGIMTMLKLHPTSLHLCVSNACPRWFGVFFPSSFANCSCMRRATKASHPHKVCTTTPKPHIVNPWWWEETHKSPRVANWLCIRESEVDIIYWTKTTSKSNSKQHINNCTYNKFQ